MTNQASSYLNDSYQTNSQTSFHATTQQNYLQQAPTNYNFQQSPHYFQQPMVNNFNNNPVQNNAPNCPMLCLMMPNGVQIPFPIMMPVHFFIFIILFFGLAMYRNSQIFKKIMKVSFDILVF